MTCLLNITGLHIYWQSNAIFKKKQELLARIDLVYFHKELVGPSCSPAHLRGIVLILPRQLLRSPACRKSLKQARWAAGHARNSVCGQYTLAPPPPGSPSPLTRTIFFCTAHRGRQDTWASLRVVNFHFSPAHRNLRQLTPNHQFSSLPILFFQGLRTLVGILVLPIPTVPVELNLKLK